MGTQACFTEGEGQARRISRVYWLLGSTSIGGETAGSGRSSAQSKCRAQRPAHGRVVGQRAREKPIGWEWSDFERGVGLQPGRQPRGRCNGSKMGRGAQSGEQSHPGGRETSGHEQSS